MQRGYISASLLDQTLVDQFCLQKACISLINNEIENHSQKTTARKYQRYKT